MTMLSSGAAQGRHGRAARRADALRRAAVARRDLDEPDAPRVREQFAGWQTGPRHDAATCNDCHVPHKLLSKYLGKAKNGWHHSSAFTLQNYPDPIRIKSGNAAVLQHNCRTCHSETVSEISGHYGSDEEGPECVHCHRNVGHGPTR